ncbi:MAG: single-stranded-DNA-specific exonuclease RecJ [Bacillota bacterium]|nr:single-stranded-DNA-specific exonuclease RecJ [Bacillota bacterium]
MKEKNWIIRKQGDECVHQLCSALAVSPIIARLLINRGFDTVSAAKDFLSKSIDQLYDPFLLPDMDKTVNRISKALSDNELITIYGDYDVDGVTSTTILFQYLKANGGRVSYYIPDRVEEGYGVNSSAVEMIAKTGCTLLITVDSGITAVEEMRYAASLGMDVIITDHHECTGEMPQAVAVIDPKRPDSEYPFKHLAGVGVVFKLLCALAGRDKLFEIVEEYSELTALGTTADVMPLNGENRILVSLGLKRLEHTKNLGLKALISLAGIEKKKVTTSVISYSIAPRINAVGRVGCARQAVELLLADSTESAMQAAQVLCSANVLRQEEENKLLAEAYKQLQQDEAILKNKIIILVGETWHHGIIGIAASRINERYGLPAILITFDGEMGKGSCRSSKSPFNIYGALELQRNYFEKFGGHASAAGFSIRRENIDPFKKALTEYVNKTITQQDLTPCIDVDCEVLFSDISLKTIKEISLLEPYGTENPTPIFLVKGVKISEVMPLSNDKHTRLTLSHDNLNVNAFCFGTPASSFPFFVGDRVDIVFNLDTNVYRGETTPQVTVRDIKLCEEERLILEKYFDLLKCYENHLPIDQKDLADILPDREDFLSVHRYIRRNKEPRTLEAMARRIAYTTEDTFNICKLKICIDVFCEMGLIQSEKIEEQGQVLYRLSILPTVDKKNLNNSTILIGLKKMRAGR